MLKRRDFRVYRFKTINKTIIYVGYTGKLTVDRFLEHAKDKYWIHEVSEVEECIIENEAQARFVEMYYINSEKPIFNAKDKFSGAIKNTLRPKDKKFSHCFYVLNGVPTSCVTSTNDDHTLVNFITLEDKHIGMYYDSYLNLYYSATDICKILNIKNKDLAKLAKNNDYFVKTTYNTVQKGKDKSNTLYLCKYEGIDKLLNLSNSDLTNKCKNRLSLSRRSSDINILYKDESEVVSVKKAYDKALQCLAGDRYNDSHLKRRLVFKSLNCNKSMSILVSNHNNDMKIFDTKFPVETLASDIFSMIEDLCNEYNLSYKDIITEFNSYIIENNNINFWEINNSTKKRLNDYKIQSHFIIAINEHILYEPFLSFYDKNMEY